MHTVNVSDNEENVEYCLVLKLRTYDGSKEEQSHNSEQQRRFTAKS